MTEPRIAQIQKELEKTTTKSSQIDDKLFEAFNNGKTKEIDLDFVKTMTNSFRNTIKSSAAEILAYRIATNRLK